MLADEVPVDAAVLMDFVNTVDERSFTVHGVTHTGGDELATRAAATQWLRDHGLLNSRAQVTEPEIGEILELRRALRDALATRAGHVSTKAIAGTNVLLATLPVAVQLDHDGAPHFVASTDRGTAARLSEVLARVAADGQWYRLRMCAARDCRWVFYDTSRNAGGRWCSMAVCGNRDKTRRYRERRMSAWPSSPPVQRLGSP